MRGALAGALAVAAATLLEAIRSRILLVSLFFALVLVVVSITAASVSYGAQSRLIIDVGLAAASGIGSIVAVALTISVFAAELRKRTAYPQLARPLPRWAFVLGKYVGLVAAMQVVAVSMIVATAVTVWLYGDSVPSALWNALWLTCVEMTVVVAVALLFSTLAVPVLAATYTAGVLIAGNLARDILKMAQTLLEDHNATGYLLRVAYYLAPDVEKLSVRTQAANELEVSFDYVLTGTVYGWAYALAALACAMLVFSRRRVL